MQMQDREMLEPFLTNDAIESMSEEIFDRLLTFVCIIGTDCIAQISINTKTLNPQISLINGEQQGLPRTKDTTIRIAKEKSTCLKELAKSVLIKRKKRQMSEYLNAVAEGTKPIPEHLAGLFTLEMNERGESVLTYCANDVYIRVQEKQQKVHPNIAASTMYIELSPEAVLEAVGIEFLSRSIQSAEATEPLKRKVEEETFKILDQNGCSLENLKNEASKKQTKAYKAILQLSNGEFNLELKLAKIKQSPCVAIDCEFISFLHNFGADSLKPTGNGAIHRIVKKLKEAAIEQNSEQELRKLPECNDVLAFCIMHIIDTNNKITENTLIKIMRGLSLGSASHINNISPKYRVFRNISADAITEKVEQLLALGALKIKKVNFGYYGGQSYQVLIPGKQFQPFMSAMVKNVSEPMGSNTTDFALAHRLENISGDMTILAELEEHPALVCSEFELVYSYMQTLDANNARKMIRSRYKIAGGRTERGRCLKTLLQCVSPEAQQEERELANCISELTEKIKCDLAGEQYANKVYDRVEQFFSTVLDKRTVSNCLSKLGILTFDRSPVDRIGVHRLIRAMFSDCELIDEFEEPQGQVVINNLVTILGCKDLEELCEQELILDSPTLGKLKDKWSKSWLYKRLCQNEKFQTVVNHLTQIASNVLLSKLSYRLISDITLQNPTIGMDLKAYEEYSARQKAIQTGILNRIPDNYVDLFPSARAIKRKFILHIGPTNSGKTYSAIERMKQAETGIYLAPLRLLAHEQYEALNRAGFPCSLITGEEQQILPGARYQSSTVEILDVVRHHYNVAVIDEAQMIEDRNRGGAWTRAILGVCADEVHICAAPNAEALLIRLIKECGDEVETVYHERQTPLLEETVNTFDLAHSVKPHDALIVFSKKKVHAVAAELQSRGYKCSVVYGSLPHVVRCEQAEQFASGENDVIVATDAIGMGMNLPIQRIVFLETYKYDGHEVRPLRSEELQQIAGRAGRKGMYNIGYYTFTSAPAKNRKLIGKAPKQLTTAFVGFPESLIGIDAPISEIFEKWNELPTQPGFQKQDLKQEHKLAKLLEKRTDNKALIFRYAMMPFDADNDVLYNLWLSYFKEELETGTPGKFKIERLPARKAVRSMEELDAMEQAHAMCDLSYVCLKTLVPEEITRIQEVKEEIENLIVGYLRKQKLRGRKCKRCGAKLPWNHEYGICDKCYYNSSFLYY